MNIIHYYGHNVKKFDKKRLINLYKDMENIITLWDKAEVTPIYPGFKLLKAKEGDLTFRLKKKDGVFFAQKEEAKPGELLKDKKLMYIPDVYDNILYRAKIRHLCEGESEERIRQAIFCKSNILYFINCYCFSFTPGLDDPVIPFITFPKQDEMIMWTLWLVKYSLIGLQEKSRSYGASWIAIFIIIWLCLFHNKKETYIFSMTEAEVDNRTRKSLLGKVRFALKYLPEWMRAGWAEYKDKVDNKMLIKFPHTGSMITGELTGGKGGRSGRADFAFYDEFAHVVNDVESIEASSDLSDSELYVSTVAGMGNEFARMTHETGANVLSLHYNQHALKNKDWKKRERAKVKYTDESWAQEQEIDYATSTSGKVFPQFVTHYSKDEWCHIVEGPYFEYDPMLPVYLSMDFGSTDPNSCVYMQIKPCPPPFFGQMVLIFDEDENRNQKTELLLKMLKDKGYRWAEMIGDAYSSNQTQFSGTTIKKDFLEAGHLLKTKYMGEETTLYTVRELLERPGSIAVNKKCVKVIGGFQNWAYPVDHNKVIISGSKPKHDNWSHIMKAVIYGLDYLFGIDRVQNKKRLGQWEYRRQVKRAI